MDAKDLRVEPVLGERNDCNPSFSHNGASAPRSDKIKPLHEVSPTCLSKVHVQTIRPCAVIGPDRVIPQPISDETYLKRIQATSWDYTENVYTNKGSETEHPSRNISPRQTFQESMHRITVPSRGTLSKPSESPNNFFTDKNYILNENVKYNIPIDYEVPYNINTVNNEPRSSVGISEMGSGSPHNNYTVMRNAHAWPMPVDSRQYLTPEVHRYAEYPNGNSRPSAVNHPMQPMHEDALQQYTDPYSRNGNFRFQPYPASKHRPPMPRYDCVPNRYNSPFPQHATHKYSVPKTFVPNPYIPYPQVPLKYLEPRMHEPHFDGYQRDPNHQSRFNLTYQGQSLLSNNNTNAGNCTSTKFSYPDAKSLPPQKNVYENPNQVMIDFDPSHIKPMAVNENSYINEIRSDPSKPPILSHYPQININRPPYPPYYRRENAPKGYAFLPHYNGIETNFNTSNPYRVTSTPHYSQTITHEPQINSNFINHNYGNFRQNFSPIDRNLDHHKNRYYHDLRKHEYRYGEPNSIKQDIHMSGQPKNDKKGIDVRQFLKMWNEGDDEHNDNKLSFTSPKESTRLEMSNKQEELYVLGLVNVPNEELKKYEHIQKISKLPENIKGYNSFELLHQFEEVVEASNFNNTNMSDKSALRLPTKPMFNNVNRPLSPLDVEAKITQSIIHKDCSFEIKPCSPKMLNVEFAAPAQSILNERTIEKVTNTITQPANIPTTVKNISIYESIQQTEEKETINIPSCKMVNTSYSTDNNEHKSNYNLNDLENNSGVCLASLPQLDTDIEFNFPEVNQQFLAANKTESSGNIYDDLQKTNFNSESKTVISKESDLPNKEYICNPLNISEKHISKLSKFRKTKTNMPENTEIHNIDIQSMRKDSVIIKNPDNIENLDSVNDNQINYVTHIKSPNNNTEKNTFEESLISPINLSYNKSIDSNVIYEESNNESGENRHDDVFITSKHNNENKQNNVLSEISDHLNSLSSTYNFDYETKNCNSDANNKHKINTDLNVNNKETVPVDINIEEFSHYKSQKQNLNDIEADVKTDLTNEINMTVIKEVESEFITTINDTQNTNENILDISKQEITKNADKIGKEKLLDDTLNESTETLNFNKIKKKEITLLLCLTNEDNISQRNESTIENFIESESKTILYNNSKDIKNFDEKETLNEKISNTKEAESTIIETIHTSSTSNNETLNEIKDKPVTSYLSPVEDNEIDKEVVNIINSNDIYSSEILDLAPRTNNVFINITENTKKVEDSVCDKNKILNENKNAVKTTSLCAKSEPIATHKICEIMNIECHNEIKIGKTDSHENYIKFNSFKKASDLEYSEESYKIIENYVQYHENKNTMEKETLLVTNEPIAIHKNCKSISAEIANESPDKINMGQTYSIKNDKENSSNHNSSDLEFSKESYKIIENDFKYSESRNTIVKETLLATNEPIVIDENCKISSAEIVNESPDKIDIEKTCINKNDKENNAYDNSSDLEFSKESYKIIENDFEYSESKNTTEKETSFATNEPTAIYKNLKSSSTEIPNESPDKIDIGKTCINENVKKNNAYDNSSGLEFSKESYKIIENDFEYSESKNTVETTSVFATNERIATYKNCKTTDIANKGPNKISVEETDNENNKKKDIYFDNTSDLEDSNKIIENAVEYNELKNAVETKSLFATNEPIVSHQNCKSSLAEIANESPDKIFVGKTDNNENDKEFNGIDNSSDVEDSKESYKVIENAVEYNESKNTVETISLFATNKPIVMYKSWESCLEKTENKSHNKILVEETDINEIDKKIYYFDDSSYLEDSKDSNKFIEKTVEYNKKSESSIESDTTHVSLNKELYSPIIQNLIHSENSWYNRNIFFQEYSNMSNNYRIYRRSLPISENTTITEGYEKNEIAINYKHNSSDILNINEVTFEKLGDYSHCEGMTGEPLGVDNIVLVSPSCPNIRLSIETISNNNQAVESDVTLQEVTKEIDNDVVHASVLQIVEINDRKCFAVGPKNIQNKLKRSLSESSIFDYSNYSKEYTDNDTNWHCKRRKINQCDNFENTTVNFIRRKSTSTIQSDDVAVCIYISNDDNCIVAHTDTEIYASEFSNHEAHLVDESSENFVTESITADEPNNNVEDENYDYNENDNIWVDDIACVETVVTDNNEDGDIYENSDDSTSDIEDNFCLEYTSNDNCSKLEEHPKHLNVYCNNDNVNKDEIRIESPNATLQHFYGLNNYSLDDKINFNHDNNIKEIQQSFNTDSHTCEFLNNHPDKFSHIVGFKLLSPLNNDVDEDEYESDISNIDTFNVAANESTQDDTIHSCESRNDESLQISSKQQPSVSSSPEVTSTTEEKKSGILLKITNYNSSKASIVDNDSRNLQIADKDNKLMEFNYSDTKNIITKPLITKAAKKYIPPSYEYNDFRVKLYLPLNKLVKLKELKTAKEAPKNNVNINKRMFERDPKLKTMKIKPNFEDVLKSIDELQFSQQKSKKSQKKVIPKVVIKKNSNGSHYASTSKAEFNPDMTGRKWQPWVFLEKNKYIDKMAIKNRRQAVYCHKKQMYISIETVRKPTSKSTKYYKSEKHSDLFKPRLKYTIRLQENG